MKVCVFGAASDLIASEYIETVERLGEMLAQRGHSLVFGAGNNGLMGAAARGFQKGGGEIHGVIPKFFQEESIEAIFDACDELIFTETMAERKSKMEDLADAFLIVPGGIGTFEELFEVLTLKQLGRHVKPIAILDINGYYQELKDLLHIGIEQGFMKEDCKLLYCYSDSLETVIDYIETDKQIKRDVHDLKNA